jgi:drug/metabolite transporter (DMT)-like permease
MRLILAYISVVLLWTTTPLAIKWSGEGPGYLFAVTSRMAIGLVCVLFILALLRRPLTWHRKAMLTYLAVAVQIYGSMILVYWSAQFIPSGWISVIFGLAPLMTAVLAIFMLKEKHLSISRFCAYCLGVYGLYLMFATATAAGEKAIFGIVGLLIATLLQSVGAIWIKQIGAGLTALGQVAGGLLLALPAYFLTWGIVDGQWPTSLSTINITSITYLGMVATTIGFSLYYYLLTHLPAVQVALISLMTPVLALMLGHLLNGEPLTQPIISGTSFIMVALVIHEVFDRIAIPLGIWKNKNKTSPKN